MNKSYGVDYKKHIQKVWVTTFEVGFLLRALQMQLSPTG